ncbi:NAD(P)H-dependent oxidoreductase [Campylobacter sp. 19-13652]|uniref:NAD(P)H-dependent oxidoreductase n=1 Tax=Campylobacter sp. 19-13652 TaxID=2840180 RepID=UPI001C75D03A|nr:NAD(P)H-dependent oxidoreductase [Campylobacter sp. 19-13652]BCX78603.1 hypothetical protein LBC_00650 [Campylobacter sp. 19-13652]
MKSLIINAHPDFASDTHASVALAHYAKSLLPDADVLNLYGEYIPRIDADMLKAWQSGEQTAAIKRQNELLEQFLASDVVLVFMPLHNFGVTSALKDYYT